MIRFVFPGPLLFLLLLPLLVAAVQAADLPAIERIRQKGVLTVALFAEDVPPFFYADKEGKLRGIDPGLAGDIADKLGVRLVFNRSATTFDEVVGEVAAGRADIAVSLLSDTLERAVHVGFSRSYVSVRQFLLINRLELGRLIAEGGGRNGAASVPALLDDPKARIGVIGGTSYVGFLAEDFPRATGVEFETWDRMLAAVKAGALTALMYDEIEIGNWRLADPAGALELRPFHLDGHLDTIAIAVNREDPDLRDWIDLYLTKIEGSGFLAALLDTYLYTADRMPTHD